MPRRTFSWVVTCDSKLSNSAFVKHECMTKIWPPIGREAFSGLEVLSGYYPSNPQAQQQRHPGPRRPHPPMALLLSPTVSFLVSPSAPRSRALSAAANVSYPGKLRWRASSILVVLFESNSSLYAVLAGWGRFLGWMSCPTSCNPRSALRMRGLWSV